MVVVGATTRRHLDAHDETVASYDLWPRGVWEHELETTGETGRSTFGALVDLCS